MKETLNASVASQSFIFEVDAYGTLKSYIDDIARRLPEEDTDTLYDIECRIAEIFRERLTSPMMVITLAQVNAAMLQMGTPSDFGEPRGGASGNGAGEPLREDGDREERAGAGEGERRLRRSLDNRSIAGICGGLGEFFGIDATLIRLLTLISIVFGGLSIWAYIILWIVIPEEEARPYYTGRNNRI